MSDSSSPRDSSSPKGGSRPKKGGSRPEKGGSRPQEDEIRELLVQRIAAVLVRDVGSVRLQDRFDDDLQADSLDLVEIIEGVEADLRERGVTVSVPDEDLVALETVEQAVQRLAAEAGSGA